MMVELVVSFQYFARLWLPLVGNYTRRDGTHSEDVVSYLSADSQSNLPLGPLWMSRHKRAGLFECRCPEHLENVNQ